jgi:hypothetical protein
MLGFWGVAIEFVFVMDVVETEVAPAGGAEEEEEDC